jgi:hypothetical protein
MMNMPVRDALQLFIAVVIGGVEQLSEETKGMRSKSLQRSEGRGEQRRGEFIP